MQAFFMNSFIKIDISITSAEEGEILMALLSEKQFYAFEEKDNLLVAYITEKDFDEDSLTEILENKYFIKTVIEDENWNEKWESELKPVVINNFVCIRASFHSPAKNVKHELIITPKMSFGTGHHDTTCLMIEQMEAIDFKDKSVLDFGTGTGVLAILSEKLGATKVLAIDYDEWSINNTMENALANSCKHISVEKRSDLPELPVDIIIANINLNVLTASSSAITRLLNDGGLLLMSGFLLRDESAIENAFGERGFVKKNAHGKNEWLSILFHKAYR